MLLFFGGHSVRSICVYVFGADGYDYGWLVLTPRRNESLTLDVWRRARRRRRRTVDDDGRPAEDVSSRDASGAGFAANPLGNPRRIPAIRRISARDSEAGLRGQPARAGGAANPAKSRACSASLTARCAVSVRPTCAAASSFLAGAPSVSRTALPRPSPARPLALLPRRRGPLLCFLAGCGIPPACPAAEATPAAHTRSATATTRLQLPPAAGNLSRLAIIIDQRPAACSLTS